MSEYTMEDKYWEAQHHIDTLYMELDVCELNLKRAQQRVSAVDGEIRKRLQEAENGE